MDEQTKEDGGIDPAQQYEDEDDDDFDPFLHAVVPRNLYHKFQTEGSKRWGPPTEILPFLFLGSCFCANEEELLRELGVDHILNVAEECPPPPTVANRKEGEKLVKHYMMVDVVEHIRKSENQWNTFESCFHFIDKARVAYEGKNGGGKKRRGSKRMKRPGKDGEEKTGERKGSGMKIRLGLKTGKDKEGGGPPEGGATGGDRVLVHCMHGRSRSATIVLAYLMKKEGWTLREAYVHVKLRRPIVGPDKYLKHQLIDYEKHLFGKSSFQNVEEFRDFQVQLTPELELKEKERKQKLKEEALQQEQSSSSNDSNTTKAGEDGGEEAEHCNKEMTADGEEEDGEEEESSGNNGNADNKDEDEGKGSGKKAKKKKKKKQSKKNKKASDEESTAAETEANVEEKRKKTKNKEKSKKRKDGSTSSGSATGSPRQDEDQEEGDEGECNNRKRGGSVASVSKDEPEQHVKTKKKKKKKLTTANSNDQPPQTTQA